MLQSMFLWIINLIFHIYSNSCAVLDLRPTACLSQFTRSAPRQATRKVMTMHHFAWRGTILNRSRSRTRDSGTCLLRVPARLRQILKVYTLGYKSQLKKKPYMKKRFSPKFSFLCRTNTIWPIIKPSTQPISPNPVSLWRHYALELEQQRLCSWGVEQVVTICTALHAFTEVVHAHAQSAPLSLELFSSTTTLGAVPRLWARSAGCISVDRHSWLHTRNWMLSFVKLAIELEYILHFTRWVSLVVYELN